MAVDLYYMDNLLRDELGALKNFYLDYSISMEKGDNTFELRMPLKNSDVILEKGQYIVSPDIECGGRIDSIRIQTQSDTIYYEGRTVRGLLESHIIIPPSGQDYYTFTGTIYNAVYTLLDSCALTPFFRLVDTGITTSVTNYKFERYIDLYSGLVKLLKENGLKFVFRKADVQFKFDIFIYPITDFSVDQEFSSDQYDMDITKASTTVNHLIGLGKGELKDRIVEHRYIDLNGNISTVPYQTGVNEVAEVYDYSSAERDELIESMVERLQEMQTSDSIKITLGDVEADVGDKFRAVEETTGIEATQYVTQKVITMTENDITCRYVAK